MKIIALFLAFFSLPIIVKSQDTINVIKEIGEDDFSILYEKHKDAKVGDLIRISTEKPTEHKSPLDMDTRDKLESFVEVKEYLESYFKQDQIEIDESAIHVSLLRSIYVFKKFTKVAGLRQYLLNHSIEEQTNTKNVIKQFDAEKTFNMYKEILFIFSKSKNGSQLAPEEIASFENCDARFKVVMKEELDLQINKYIEENFFAIKSEIKKL